MHGKQGCLTRLYLNWSFFGLWHFGVVSLLVANQLKGTKYQFFGPGSKRWASSTLRQRLEACPPNHVCLLWFQRFREYDFIDEEIRDINLSDATEIYGGVFYEPSWLENTTMSIQHDGKPKLTPEQVAKVEKVIGSMPDSNSTGPIEKTLSVAINRDGKLRIYHYQLDFEGDNPLKNVPVQIGDLSGGF